MQIRSWSVSYLAQCNYWSFNFCFKAYPMQFARPNGLHMSSENQPFFCLINVVCCVGRVEIQLFLSDARNVRLYYPYRQYINPFTFHFLFTSTSKQQRHSSSLITNSKENFISGYVLHKILETYRKSINCSQENQTASCGCSSAFLHRAAQKCTLIFCVFL